MNRNKKQVDSDKSKAVWVAAKITVALLLGVVMIFFWGNGVLALITHYKVTACRSLYEVRELEILSYRWGPGDTSEDPLRIQGIIHPDKIEVQTDDNSVSLMSFNSSDSRIQMTPSEESVLGKRVDVSYYVGNDEDRRWRHPARIHNHVQFSPQAIVGIWLFTSGYLAVMFFCFFYAYRTNCKFASLFPSSSNDSA